MSCCTWGKWGQSWRRGSHKGGLRKGLPSIETNLEKNAMEVKAKKKKKKKKELKMQVFQMEGNFNYFYY